MGYSCSVRTINKGGYDMSVEFLDKGNDDGTVLGQDSSKLIGFWGVDPVDQPATITNVSTTNTVGEVSTALKALITSLKEIGIIASA
jgi:hypothetical protein